jgi:hypothetical protein
MGSDQPFHELHEDEFILTGKGEVLRRQVHPTFLDRGQPSSQAFRKSLGR